MVLMVFSDGLRQQLFFTEVRRYTMEVNSFLTFTPPIRRGGGARPPLILSI